MSRIGRKPIPVPQGVKIAVTTDKIDAILVDAGSQPKWSWKLGRAGLHPLASGRAIGGVIIYRTGR